MNWRSSAIASSGQSRQAPWPALGKVTSRPQGWGIAAAISCASANGVTGSSSPAITSTGHCTRARPGSSCMVCCSPLALVKRMSSFISVRARATGSPGVGL
jgi:hypothetical protein